MFSDAAECVAEEDVANLSFTLSHPGGAGADDCGWLGRVVIRI